MYYIIFIGKCKKPYCDLENHFVKLVYKKVKIYLVENEIKAVKLAESLKNKLGIPIFILDSKGEILNLSKIKEAIFIVGPEKGFSREVKEKYKAVSLSPLEFNHLLARILLLEQIYRKINKRYKK